MNPSKYTAFEDGYMQKLSIRKYTPQDVYEMMRAQGKTPSPKFTDFASSELNKGDFLQATQDPTKRRLMSAGGGAALGAGLGGLLGGGRGAIAGTMVGGLLAFLADVFGIGLPEAYQWLNEAWTKKRLPELMEKAEKAGGKLGKTNVTVKQLADMEAGGEAEAFLKNQIATDRLADLKQKGITPQNREEAAQLQRIAQSSQKEWINHRTDNLVKGFVDEVNAEALDRPELLRDRHQKKLTEAAKAHAQNKARLQYLEEANRDWAARYPGIARYGEEVLDKAREDLARTKKPFQQIRKNVLKGRLETSPNLYEAMRQASSSDAPEVLRKFRQADEYFKQYPEAASGWNPLDPSGISPKYRWAGGGLPKEEQALEFWRKASEEPGTYAPPPVPEEQDAFEKEVQERRRKQAWLDAYRKQRKAQTKAYERNKKQRIHLPAPTEKEIESFQQDDQMVADGMSQKQSSTTPMWWDVLAKSAALPADPAAMMPQQPPQPDPNKVFDHNAKVTEMKAQAALEQSKADAEVKKKQAEMSLANNQAGIDTQSKQMETQTQQAQQQQQMQAPTNPAVNPSPQQPLGYPQPQPTAGAVSTAPVAPQQQAQ